MLNNFKEENIINTDKILTEFIYLDTSKIKYLLVLHKNEALNNIEIHKDDYKLNLLKNLALEVNKKYFSDLNISEEISFIDFNKNFKKSIISINIKNLSSFQKIISFCQNNGYLNFTEPSFLEHILINSMVFRKLIFYTNNNT